MPPKGEEIEVYDAVLPKTGIHFTAPPSNRIDVAKVFQRIRYNIYSKTYEDDIVDIILSEPNFSRELASLETGKRLHLCNPSENVIQFLEEIDGDSRYNIHWTSIMQDYLECIIEIDDNPIYMVARIGKDGSVSYRSAI